MNEREQAILAMHKAGLSDTEMLDLLSMRGDKAALRYKAEEREEAERYSEAIEAASNNIAKMVKN